MNKKGFTLIELLAVIIILGILMIIAIPSVTKYISDSRKNAYIDTAKEIIGGARNLVNEGKLEMYDTDTTYYIESGCIKTENASKSPYGDFTKAYVVVTYDGNGYTYYWTSVDDAGQGIKDIIRIDKLDPEIIESDLKDSEISTLRGIDGRSKTVVISKQNNCQKEGANDAGPQINGETGEENILVCKKVTDATKLNSITCSANDYGCKYTSGAGATITYGTIGNGTPKPGDAYDCKVTKNGDYTERFYYVGNSENYSILIYYKNISDQTTYAYDSSNRNYKGPVTGYQYLPDTTTWNNSGLISPGTRQIIAENNATSTTGGTIQNFEYTGKAARFLTYQEVQMACNKSLITNTGNLSSCNWLLDNVGRYEGETGSYGYWLETPVNSDNTNIWNINGYYIRSYSHGADDSVNYGVRPVITVKTSDIEQ